MIDMSSHSAIIEAAEPFDTSFQKGRPVMLAGTEIVGFARFVATEICGERQVPGRRAADCAKADRIAELEREVARLQAALELGDALRNRERRYHDEPVEVERRVAAPRK
jgi:hypothetical protein